MNIVKLRFAKEDCDDTFLTMNVTFDTGDIRTYYTDAIPNFENGDVLTILFKDTSSFAVEKIGGNKVESP